MAPAPETDSGIRDNHTRGSVGAFLQEKIQRDSTLSIVSAGAIVILSEPAGPSLRSRVNSAKDLCFGNERCFAAGYPLDVHDKPWTLAGSLALEPAKASTPSILKL